MKIGVAQTQPVKGDIQKNIENHKELISHAISAGADMIIFPELSITGYEPELAKELATTQDDNKFDDFQKISDTNHITIGVGAPTKKDNGVCISMIVFQPEKPRQTYSKKYLHVDEEAFFVSGENFSALVNGTNIALAICYELSIPAHSENAAASGAETYIASAVKTRSGAEKAVKTLADIGKKYSMTVLFSNCIGQSGGYDCAGNTSIWNNEGLLLAQLNSTNEGILIIDTDTQEITERVI
jgi:predicted amidohydrolase